MAERLDLKFSDVVNDINSAAGRVVVDPNNPTIEGQQAVQAWLDAHPGYEKKEFTNKYMEGYEPPPQDIVSPDTKPTSNKGFNGMPSNLQQYVNSTTPAGYYDKESQSVPQEEQTPRTPQTKNTEAFDKVMTAWTPLAASAFQSSDPSGFAASTRAQAAQYDKNAAENQKILQWNQQRANDNMLADKIAAAQAAKSRKQAAETVGLEGGAMAAAEATQQVTPDYMTEKNYQKQAMDTATQNLAEVNRNKLEAQAARGDANQAEYNERYMNSKDTYVSNLAQAKNDQNKKEETKPEEKPDEKPAETTEEKPDSNVEGTDSHGSKAETNQQSNTVADATQQQADVQRLVDVIEEVKGINVALKNGGSPQDYREKYEKLAKEYKELNAKVGDKVQQTLEPFYTDDSTEVGSIASTLGDVKFGG